MVSHVGAFPASAAIVPPRLNQAGTANGHVYREADLEIFPDGEVGNPLILRYKFISPSGAIP